MEQSSFFEDEIACTWKEDGKKCGKVWLVTVSKKGWAKTIAGLTGYICPDCSGYNSEIWPARRKDENI